MTVIFRDDIGEYTGKGSKLTKGELDGNFHDLLLRIIELETGGAFGLDSIEYNGASITFHWSDETSSGPFFLPVATFRARGVWDNDLELMYLDVVTVPSVGTFLVMIDHTTDPSPAVFDPAADNDSGDPLYLQISEAVDLTDVMFFRGTYTAATQYDAGDVVVDVTYGTFYVNSLHTAGSTLDQYLEDGDSVPVYSQVAGPPFAPVEVVTDATYEVSAEDRGKYLKFTQGCLITFPQLSDMPLHSEVHFEQAGDEDLVFQAEDELVVTVDPQRWGYSASTPYKGAVVTAKYVAADHVKLIGPHGDEVSS